MSSVVREKSKLFTPLPLADGTITLKHRIAMAPLTRQRSPNHVPTEMVGQYYEQRASDGGLLISEGTLISPMVLFDTVGIAKI
jgi:2,4-dienoyl-CoA reductase-like NADH-dependent reductase (Old Yellow Enzyme family)